MIFINKKIMNQYFFSVSKAEKQNILDQHKTIYDGFVTQYGQQGNKTPLYVQDLANDKGGITVSNQGNVTTYKNFKINEDINRKDRIGDGSMDLKNGTVDLDKISDTILDDSDFIDIYPSPNEDEEEYISLGNNFDNDDDIFEFIFGINKNEDLDSQKEINDSYYEYDIDEIDNFDTEKLNESILEVDEDLQDKVEVNLFKSLDMFNRFKKYN